MSCKINTHLIEFISAGKYFKYFCIPGRRGDSVRPGPRGQPGRGGGRSRHTELPGGPEGLVPPWSTLHDTHTYVQHRLVSNKLLLTRQYGLVSYELLLTRQYGLVSYELLPEL